MQEAVQEEGRDLFPRLGACPVSRVLHILSGEVPQDSFYLGRAQASAAAYLAIWSYCCRIDPQSMGLVGICYTFA